VVTQEGQPIFELLPIRADDPGFIDGLIERDPSFRELVEQAREDVRSGRVSLYAEACSLACQGQHDDAWLVYIDLKRAIASAEKFSRLRALIQNDLAVLAAMGGRFDEARAGWQTALEIDRDCLMARLNRDLVEAEIHLGEATEFFLS
jgi:hypothetical protein